MQETVDQIAIEMPSYPSEANPSSEMPVSPNVPRSSANTSSSFGLTDLTVFIPGSVWSKGQLPISLPRWKTPEFIVYWIILIVAIPQMALAVIQISQRKYNLCLNSLEFKTHRLFSYPSQLL